MDDLLSHQSMQSNCFSFACVCFGTSFEQLNLVVFSNWNTLGVWLLSPRRRNSHYPCTLPFPWLSDLLGALQRRIRTSNMVNATSQSVNLQQAERWGAAVCVALNFRLLDTSASALQCCCWKDPPLFVLHLQFLFISWIQIWCSPSTLTPIMLSGKTENQGLCSGFLSPCTGNSTRIKECKIFIQINTTGLLLSLCPSVCGCCLKVQLHERHLTGRAES